jgi:hypothetical protein
VSVLTTSKLKSLLSLYFLHVNYCFLICLGAAFAAKCRCRWTCNFKISSCCAFLFLWRLFHVWKQRQYLIRVFPKLWSCQ